MFASSHLLLVSCCLQAVADGGTALYKTVFIQATKGFSLVPVLKEGTFGLPQLLGRPENLPQGERVPVAGDRLWSVNGVSFAGDSGAYKKTRELLESARRPVTLEFLPQKSYEAAVGVPWEVAR